MTSALTAGLNQAQREAVEYGDGPLLVLAGAGSGKTRVLTTRITRLIQERGIDPQRILAVTFTNKAAGEMRERIGRQLGEEPKGMWMGTFHSIGARIVRRSAEKLHRSHSFTIYDDDEQLQVVKRLMERHRISPKSVAPRAIRAAISDAKNQLVSVADYTKLARDPFAQDVAKVYGSYEEAYRTANAVDFDDLLVMPVRLLEGDPRELERWQKRFDHILVDEYQDTNHAQYRFIKLLGREHKNVCVVGDDDQSIYGWRGADIKNILDFTRDFPDAGVVKLEENYRSTPEVLQLANAVISANTSRMGKTLRPTLPSGDRVTVMRCLDERDECDWLLGEVMARRAQRANMLRDFVVLYRTNSQSRAIEEGCRRHSIPYRLVGSVRFYDRREIRDLMAYLRLIANPSDDEAFRRAVSTPKRGIGDTTVEFIAERARQEGISLMAASKRGDILTDLRPAAKTSLTAFTTLIDGFCARITELAVDEMLRELIIDTRYDEHLRAEGEEAARERMLNVRSLVDGAAETVEDAGGEVGITPLDSFLQRAALVADIDALDKDSDALTLMSMHNAKGLEFPIVFVTGLEDGLFPLARAYEEPSLLEEERRLFYVAITRAERTLMLSYVEERFRNGQRMPAGPSSFLTDIPRGMIDEKSTIKVRGSGRAVMSSMQRSSQWGGRRSTIIDDDDSFESVPAGRRRVGTPVQRRVEAEDESQVDARYAIGARVRHRLFGAGTVAEIGGAGKQAKVKIDFDDDNVGRKTLVIAQAHLESEID